MVPGLPVTDPTCCRLGCEHAATWQPVIILRAYGMRRGAECLLRLGICAECRPLCEVGSFINDQGFANIIAGMKAIGVQPPDLSLTTLAW